MQKRMALLVNKDDIMRVFGRFDEVDKRFEGTASYKDLNDYKESIEKMVNTCTT